MLIAMPHFANAEAAACATLVWEARRSARERIHFGRRTARTLPVLPPPQKRG
jgi:hypothetical protein